MRYLHIWQYYFFQLRFWWDPSILMQCVPQKSLVTMCRNSEFCNSWEEIVLGQLFPIRLNQITVHFESIGNIWTWIPSKPANRSKFSNYQTFNSAMVNRFNFGLFNLVLEFPMFDFTHRNMRIAVQRLYYYLYYKTIKDITEWGLNKNLMKTKVHFLLVNWVCVNAHHEQSICCQSKNMWLIEQSKCIFNGSREKVLERITIK